MNHKVRYYFLLPLLGLLLGCSSLVKNNTPAKIPQNGSDLYRIKMSVYRNNSRVDPKSYTARIVINGETHNMRKIGDYDFAYDYKRPEKMHKASFYYEVDCKRKGGSSSPKTVLSDLYHLTIINRYIIGFDSNRGIPGATVSVLGRGLMAGDEVEIGGISCPTTFVSNNVLSFVVPDELGPGEYLAKLLSENGNIGLGQFYVDPSQLKSDVSAINLAPGEKRVIVISTNMRSSAKDIFINVTTNVPDSVMMPDITIPAGEGSAAVIVQGLEPGSGMMFLCADGHEELTIPIKISESADNKGKSPVNADDMTDEQIWSL